MGSQFPIPDLYGGGEVTQDTLQNTRHVNLSVLQNHLRHLLRYRYLDFTPEFLIQEIWGGTLEFASLTSCQELLMLFVHQRHLFGELSFVVCGCNMGKRDLDFRYDYHGPGCGGGTVFCGY